MHEWAKKFSSTSGDDVLEGALEVTSLERTLPKPASDVTMSILSESSSSQPMDPNDPPYWSGRRLILWVSFLQLSRVIVY